MYVLIMTGCFFFIKQATIKIMIVLMYPLIYFTGHETTSSMLSFMLAEAGKNPEVENRQVTNNPLLTLPSK